MRDEINNIINYYSAFEGGKKNDVNKIKSLAERLFHPDLLVELIPDGNLSMAQFTIVEEACARGGMKVDLVGLKVNDEAVEWKTNMTVRSGKVLSFNVTGTFMDGKLHSMKRSRCDRNSILRRTSSNGSSRSLSTNTRRVSWNQNDANSQFNPAQDESSSSSSSSSTGPRRVSWNESIHLE
mmetsp:Transcript_39939/g.68140  ORF Transcript_39939/g.68140 Transcript_39939/m.68140 type:complete len:181 (+) Transcript_39939:83-625(+)